MILAVLSLISVLAFAQAPDLIGAQFRDFSGGYVDTYESANLQPNQSPNTQDGIIDDPAGSFKPRNGFTQCGVTPSGSAATNLYQFTKSDGSKQLIVTDNATIWYTRDCVTFTTIYSGLSSTQQVYFTTARDKVWAVNGSTWPITWDGTTATLLDGRINTPSNPKMPKCAYVEFWRERVWCAKDTINFSGVSFSAITDTNGNDVDPSTGAASWPATNLFQIDQNGGSSIYGLKAYRNRLYVFKDNGIWEIQFASEFDNAIRKTYSSVGSRFQSAIAEVDGYLYFVGKDGIYAFDGDNSVRLSRDIENKFGAIRQPLINNQYKTWTSQADFNAGTTVLSSTADIIGSVVVSTGYVVTPSGVNADFEGGATNWTYATQTLTGSCASAGGTANSGATDTDSAIEGTKLGRLTINACSTNCIDPGGAGSGYDAGKLFVNVKDGNGTSLLSDTLVSTGINTLDLPSLTTNYVRLFFTSRNYTGSGTPILLDEVDATMNAGFIRAPRVRFQYVRTTTGASANCSAGDGGFAYNHKFDIIQNLTYFTTASWRSEVYNAVTVSSWTTFDAVSVDNGGSIIYQIHLGRDTADISTKAWTTITPGGIINGTTDQIYVQINASFTVTTTYTPELQLASVQWSQGAATSNKMFLAGWKNRPWISASSGTATTNNLVLVKSRLPLNSWMPYNMQIGPMATFNDAFYVGASTHSGIYRMDYGTSDNGAVINWFWETRDEMFGLPNNRKTLLEIGTDFKKGTAYTTQVGYSKDYGASYNNKTIPMNGSDRGSSRSFVNGGLAFSYRFRVGNSTLNEVATITGISGYVRPLKLRE